MSSLFIDRRGIELEVDAGALVVREQGERIGTIPLAPLTRVFLRGDVKLSASLLGQLGEHGIGVVILSGRRGKPTLMLARPHNDASRRVAQIRKSLDEDFCLAIAQDLVKRKIEYQIEWLMYIGESNLMARYPLARVCRQLQPLFTKVGETKNLANLRGLEGAAAAIYFDGLKEIVPESLHFKGRNRRPPRDPFNAVLSLGYTLAHSEIAIALFGAGLDPYVGFYHQIEFGRESLASDLLEPIRPRVDRFALRLFNEQTLRADDFSTNEKGCMLGKAGRARFYSAWEAASTDLRTAISAEVDALLERLGCTAQQQQKSGNDNGFDNNE